MSFLNLRYLCGNTIKYTENRETYEENEEAIVTEDKEFMLCSLNKYLPYWTEDSTTSSAAWINKLYFNYICHDGCMQLYNINGNHDVMFIQSVSECDQIRQPYGKINDLSRTNYEQALMAFEDAIKNYRNTSLYPTDDVMSNCLNQSFFNFHSIHHNSIHPSSLQDKCEDFNITLNIMLCLILGVILFILVVRIAIYSHNIFKKKNKIT